MSGFFWAYLLTGLGLASYERFCVYRRPVSLTAWLLVVLVAPALYVARAVAELFKVEL